MKSNACGTGFPRIAAGRDGQDASKSKFSDAAHVAFCHPDLSPGGAPLLLGVLRPGAGKYDKPIMQIRWQARLPAGTDSRCGRSSLTDADAGRASTLNSVLPEHSVSTCPPSFAEAAYGRLPARRRGACVLLITAICPSGACGVRKMRETGRVGGNPKCKMRDLARILVGIPKGARLETFRLSCMSDRARAKKRLHRSCAAGLWPEQPGNYIENE